MSEETLRLKLTLKEIPVVLEGEEGEEVHYVLREMPGDERADWMNKMRKRLSMGVDGKTVSILNYKGFQESLLTKCLFNSDNENVKPDVLQKWPGGTLTELFKRAQELSGLDMKDANDIKKMDREGLSSFITSQGLDVDPEDYPMLRDLRKVVSEEFGEDGSKNE